MIIIIFGKWSSRKTKRFCYERIYIKGKWSPFCKIEKRIYAKGGYIPRVGPIGRDGLREALGKAVVNESEEVEGMNLKKCIRCNGQARLRVGTGESLVGPTIDAYIECSECRLRTRIHRSSMGNGESVEAAIKDWNEEEKVDVV